jgi:hypothetical protein
VKTAAAVMANPRGSLPKQHRTWGDLKATYGLLSNDAVDPRMIQQPHRDRTWQRCRDVERVLVVQDDTELDFSRRAARGSVQGMGPLSGPGLGRGLYQHTTMAVDARTGRALGLLDQRWWARDDKGRQNETRRQRQARHAESDRWADVAKALADRHEATDEAKLVHVGDRGSDVWRFLNTCHHLGHGFVIRAVHNRYVGETRGQKLWPAVLDTPARASLMLTLTRQRKRDGKVTRQPRQARAALRYTSLTLPPPSNDPRTADSPPLRITAVHVHETDLPEGIDEKQRVNWMLLTDRPVSNADQALEVVADYRKRWRIEEFHRCLKQGCRIEHARLDHAKDIQRLAAIQSVVAVQLLQTRDAASDPGIADDPEALVPISTPTQRQVVAMWADKPAEELTPKLFHETIARRGGWIGRKSDGRPGWLTLHRGMQDLTIATETLLQLPRPPTCG